MSVVCNETVTVDPETGMKRRTVVTERVVTTKTFKALAVDGDGNVSTGAGTGTESLSSNYGFGTGIGTGKPFTNGYSITTATTNAKGNDNQNERVVTFDCNPFLMMNFDRIGDVLIVTRVRPDSTIAKEIHAGDSIREVNGELVTKIKDFTALKDKITIKLASTTLHQGPSVFYLACADYDGSSDNRVPSNLKGLNLKKGDIVQAFSRDAYWIQGRKVNDLSLMGVCPIDVTSGQMSMLTPYGRRVLVLLGVPGVGRRTLKTMLLTYAPNHFTTATPYTSRAPKPHELEGREYYFRTKEEMLKKVRDGEMIEWGELDGQIYGTSLETVRSCVRGGRVCVLDCAPQALRHLYNSEFMPFIVLISPPEIDELQLINKLRAKPYTEEEMNAYIKENKDLLESAYAKMFHMVIVNRNLDTTFKRLVEALEQLKQEVQWVPESWMRGTER